MVISCRVASDSGIKRSGPLGRCAKGGAEIFTASAFHIRIFPKLETLYKSVVYFIMVDIWQAAHGTWHMMVTFANRGFTIMLFCRNILIFIQKGVLYDKHEGNQPRKENRVGLRSILER